MVHRGGSSWYVRTTYVRASYEVPIRYRHNGQQCAPTCTGRTVLLVRVSRELTTTTCHLLTKW